MKELLTLFKLSDFETKKTVGQEDFEQRHMELLTSFPDMVDRSFERLNRDIYPIIEPESRDKNMAATLISGFLRGEIIKYFPLYCGKATTQRFRLKFEDSEWIYIKKLNEQKKPSNIDTRDNTIILNQISETETDICPNIFLGYIGNPTMTEPIGIYAVYIVGEKVEWFSDLRTLASLQVTERTKQLSIPKEEVALKEGIVKIKPKTGTDNINS